MARATGTRLLPEFHIFSGQVRQFNQYLRPYIGRGVGLHDYQVQGEEKFIVMESFGDEDETWGWEILLENGLRIHLETYQITNGTHPV